MTDDTSVPSSSPPPPKRFLRAHDDRVLAGVCGGLGRYFGIDPLIFRIAAVALAFFGGTGVIAYLAAVVFAPADDGSGRPAPRGDGWQRLAMIGGAIALCVAALAIVDGPAWWFGGAVIPLAILAALGYFAWQLVNDRDRRPPGTRRTALVLVLVAIGCIAACIAFVAAVWVSAAGGGEYVAAAVIVLGAAAVVAGLRGRSRWLVVPALVLALPLGVVAAADIDTDGGVGEREYRPLGAADIPSDGYELGIGELVVDLRDIEWPSAPLRIKAELGIGHLLVVVPADVCVRAGADVGAGNVDVLGDDAGGADLEFEAGSRRAEGRSLLLDAKLGLGAVEVSHSRTRHRDGIFDHDGPETNPCA